MERRTKTRVPLFHGSYESFIDYLLQDEDFLKTISTESIEILKKEKTTVELVRLFQNLGTNNGS